MTHKFRIIRKRGLFYIQYRLLFWWKTLGSSHDDYASARKEVQDYFDSRENTRVMAVITLENGVIRERL